MGIIIEDKMNDLINYYIKESDVEASYKTALFFKELFDEGFDLSIRELNNSAFVFISKELLDEAEMLLLEAKRKISFEEQDDENIDSSCFIYYNYGMICIKKDKIDEALLNFRKILEINRAHEKICGDATVLKLLKIGENNDLQIIEVKEGNLDYPKFTCKMFAEININVLEQYKQRG